MDESIDQILSKLVNSSASWGISLELGRPTGRPSLGRWRGHADDSEGASDVLG